MRYDRLTPRHMRTIRCMKAIGRPATAEEIAAASTENCRVYLSQVKPDLPSMRNKGAVVSEIGPDGIERWSVAKDVK